MDIISVGVLGESIIVGVALDANKFRQDNAIPEGAPIPESSLSKEAVSNYLKMEGQ